MAMPAGVFYNAVRLFVGDRYRITDRGQESGLGPSGADVRLLCLWDRKRNDFLDNDEHFYIENPDSDQISLGMYCDDHSMGAWGDLKGMCGDNHGFWISPGAVLTGIKIIRTHAVQGDTPINSSNGKVRYIKSELIFKRKSLIGKKCTIIRPFKRFSDSSSYFVEFEENIGGCSCDGLGKSGHCLPVNAKFLVKSPKTVENFKEEHSKALGCLSI